MLTVEKTPNLGRESLAESSGNDFPGSPKCDRGWLQAAHIKLSVSQSVTRRLTRAAGPAALARQSAIAAAAAQPLQRSYRTIAAVD